MSLIAVGCGPTPATSTDGDPTTIAEPRATTPTVLDIPTVAISGPQRDVPVPYFGSQAGDGGVMQPATGFEPAAADIAFCDAIEVINSRPQPSDDYEEIVVAREYFLVIEPVVPDELGEPFARSLAFTEAIASAGSFDDVSEPQDGDALLQAIHQINGFVDERCLGR